MRKSYLLATNHIHQMLVDRKDGGVLDGDITRAGLYQWYRAFKEFGSKGDVKFYEDCQNDLEKYDIVHINLCTNDSHLVEPIWNKLRNSSTKLIVNLDYKIEEVQYYFDGVNKPDYNMFKKCISLCDMLFVQEPYQKDVLSMIRPGYDIPVIPHPVDSRISKYSVSISERFNKITCIYHCYDNQFFIPKIILDTEEITKNCKTELLGHNPMCDPAQGPPPRAFYDLVLPIVDYEEVMYKMSHSFCLLDTYSMHSHGRTQIESAVLGVPCVGRNEVSGQKYLYPEITSQVGNDAKMREYIIKLGKDNKFYDDVSNYAKEKVKDYYWESKYNELVQALETRIVMK